MQRFASLIGSFFRMKRLLVCRMAQNADGPLYICEVNSFYQSPFQQMISSFKPYILQLLLQEINANCPSVALWRYLKVKFLSRRD